MGHRSILVWHSYALTACIVTCPTMCYMCSQALQEKELGNAAYKKKDFEIALKHYSVAIDKDPTSIVYRNNRAG